MLRPPVYPFVSRADAAAGMVPGASAPIVLTSRADSLHMRLASRATTKAAPGLFGEHNA